MEMRSAPLLALFCSLIFFPQHTDIWQRVSANPGPLHLRTLTPNPKQLAIIRKALAARVQLDNWPCAEGEEPDWAEKVTFKELPVSTSEEVVLIEAGAGCARGGQGSNGAMWVMKFQGGKAYFLATPEKKFNGWLYSIQPSSSHGFRDLVLGWHMSAMETNLAYFGFDGRSYQLLGSAQRLANDADVAKIVPTPIS
jgi:hypothetical protein